ncbi:hypothetical protein BDV3_003083 [Batrachochytrium dendrobatidis]
MSFSPSLLGHPGNITLASLGGDVDSSVASPIDSSTDVTPDIPLFTSTCQVNAIAQQTATGLQSVQVVLKPMVGRGFTFSDNHWTSYRRNYFQISATYAIINAQASFGGLDVDSCDGEAISNTVGLVALTDHGLVPIQHFSIGIAARCMDETDNVPVDLIQRTAKRERGPKIIPTHIPCAPLPDLQTAPQDAPSGTVVVYERLQFRSTTTFANRRRIGKQYHTISVQLWATLFDGSEILVASIETAPLVVRSKSPRHYAEKLDMSLMDDSGMSSGFESNSPSIHSPTPRLRKVGDGGWRGSLMAKTLPMQQMQQQIKQHLQYQPHQQPPSRQLNLLQYGDESTLGMISPAMSESHPQLSFLNFPLNNMSANGFSEGYSSPSQSSGSMSQYDSPSPSPLLHQALNRVASPSPSMNGRSPSPNPYAMFLLSQSIQPNELFSNSLLPTQRLQSTQLNSTQLNSAQLNSAQLNSAQLNSAQLNSAQLNSTQSLSMPSFDLLGMGNLQMDIGNDLSNKLQSISTPSIDAFGYDESMKPLAYDFGEALAL